jgi:hypothetical protein
MIGRTGPLDRNHAKYATRPVSDVILDRRAASGRSASATVLRFAAHSDAKRSEPGEHH